MKNFLGVIAIIIALLAYIPYFRDIYQGKTKPHAFTWFIWFLLTAIAFVAQVHDGAGAGAWVTGVTAAISFIIFIAGLMVGKKNIVKIDWIFLFGAFAAIGVWAITDNPTASVIIVTLVDMLAFVPTFRKSYFKPNEETAITYSLSGLKFAVAIAALSSVTLVTALYPLSLVITNGLFVAMVMIRRKKVGEAEGF